MHKGVIYKCTNLINGFVYIGQTKNFSKKVKQHIYVSGNKNDRHYNVYLYQCIREFGKDNFKWEILEKLSAETEDKLRELLYIEEEAYILYYNCVKPNGMNVARGGAGNSSSPSEECRKMMSIQMRGENNPNYGKPMIEEQKKKISEAISGEKHPFWGTHRSEETREKISKANKGTKPAEHTIEMCRKKVLQYTLNGEFVKEWKSLSDAAKECKTCVSNISRSCKYGKYPAGGYMWKYVEI